MARNKGKRRRNAAQPSDPQAAGSSSVDTPTVDEPAPKRAKTRTFDERWKTDTRSPQEVLDAQMDTWRSTIYDHFQMPPEILVEDEVVKYRFYCRKHPSEFVTRARTDSSTSNLNSHVDLCDPEVVDGEGTIAKFAHGSTYNKSRFRYLTTVWVTTCFRPFAIVDDPPLQQMLKMLYAQVEIPSATTVSRDVKEVFTIAKTAVAAFLKKQKALIHIAFDGWTAPNVLSFLGVVVVFENSGVLASFVLDFIRLRQGHTGTYLASKLHECLEGYGISDKIYGQTGDNASNNDTMVEELGRRLGGRSGPHTRVRCLCHVLNLCVKAILRPFTKSRPKKGVVPATQDEDSDIEPEDTEDENTARSQEEADDDEIDADCEASDEAALDEIMESTLQPGDLSDSERIFAQNTLTKVASLTKRIFHSPVLRDDLQDLCHKHGLKPLGVVRPVPTRWNSMAMTSKRAIYLRAPLKDLVVKASHNTSRGPRLLRYKLSDEEWQILDDLDAILAYFLEATEHMSVKGRPLLHEVIPVIDFIEGILANVIADEKKHPAIQAAAALGRAVLNKYYEKTDESIMYRCAILLHPRYKTAYFKAQKWPQLWIDTALSLLREEWEHYKPKVTSTAPAADDTPSRPGLLAAISIQYSSGGTDALEEYLISPPIPSVSDPIKHWHSLDSEHNPLARMALDILSTPATSVDAERAFSRGGLTVSKLRRNLSDESTRAATVFSSWMKIPGLVPEAEIIQMFAQKSSRSKTAGTSGDDAILVD